MLVNCTGRGNWQRQCRLNTYWYPDLYSFSEEISIPPAPAIRLRRDESLPYRWRSRSSTFESSRFFVFRRRIEVINNFQENEHKQNVSGFGTVVRSIVWKVAWEATRSTAWGQRISKSFTCNHRLNHFGCFFFGMSYNKNGLSKKSFSKNDFLGVNVCRDGFLLKMN